MNWLGGVLCANGFEDLSVVDFYTVGTRFDGIDALSVRQVLSNHGGDVFLFSPMTLNLFYALEIATIVKELYPSSIVIFGGVVATPLRRQVAHHLAVDYVVADRAEWALPTLLKVLVRGATPNTVGNLTYSNCGELVESNFMYPYPDVAALPFPKVDLFPRDAGLDIRYIRQVHGLGCPYDCPFCTIQTIRRKPSYFPVSRVLDEIREYRSYYGEHHNVYWGDETFALNPHRAFELCNALREDGTIEYDCQTRFSCLSNKAVLKAMADSGCRWIEIGLETDNEESRALFKQGMSVKCVEETLARVRDLGIAACSYTVHGFPNQTVDEMKKSADWISSLIAKDLLQASYLSVLVPYPGSPMYDHPDAFGIRIHERDFRYYNEQMPPVFDTRHATSEQIYEVFRYALRSFGEAMSKQPYLCPVPVDNPEAFGRFGSYL